MIRDIEKSNEVRGTIRLWVEDEATSVYLSEIWRDPRIAINVAGGNVGVHVKVKAEEPDGARNSFGLRDRDFSSTNKDGYKADWSNPYKNFRTFVLPVHEIENYLLDSTALESSPYNNLRKNRTEIDNMIQEECTRRCWWVACCEVLSTLKERLCSELTGDPRPSVDDLKAALEHICDSAWFRKIESESRRNTRSDIEKMLSDAHEETLLKLEDEDWRFHFPG